jgi:hypothetical protein
LFLTYSITYLNKLKMGTLINGLFGGFHGRVGNLVGYTLKGKYVLRTIGKSHKPLTPARKANCQKMTVVNEILKPSLRAIRVGFRLAVAGTDKNEYNEAVSYNKKNALQGVYPNVSLDYTKVLMSMGNLPVALNPSISQVEEKITFQWEDSVIPGSEYASDRAMLVVYFPDIKETCCQLIGAKRIEGKDVVTISSEHINERMEAYISFVKDDGRRISNSVYAGSLNVEPDQPEEIINREHYIREKLKFDLVEKEYLRLRHAGKHLHRMEFLKLEKEYFEFQKRLESLPGKPG